MITYRRRNSTEFTHFSLFSARDWGLVIYDEVHLLPAPVFRVTAEIQARRRLGLTATLVRGGRARGRGLLAHRPPRSTTCRGRSSSARAGSRRRTASRCACRCGPSCPSATSPPARASASASPARTPDKLPVIQRLVLQHADDPRAHHRPVPRPARRAGGRPQVPAHLGPHAHARARGPLPPLPRRRPQGAGRQQGGQLRRGPARRQRGHPGPRAPSGAGRRRPSASGASCAPSPTAARPSSIRSSRVTAARSISPTTGNLFLTEQGYTYEIRDARSGVRPGGARGAGQRAAIRHRGPALSGGLRTICLPAGGQAASRAAGPAVERGGTVGRPRYRGTIHRFPKRAGVCPSGTPQRRVRPVGA